MASHDGSLQWRSKMSSAPCGNSLPYNVVRTQLIIGLKRYLFERILRHFSLFHQCIKESRVQIVNCSRIRMFLRELGGAENI